MQPINLILNLCSPQNFPQREEGIPSKAIILVGSGHGHLEVIRRLTRVETAKHRFFLISPHRESYYSGLVPRLIAGDIAKEDLTVNSADLAEEKGFVFMQDKAESIDQKNGLLCLESGTKIPFDVLSINAGGAPTPIQTDSPECTISLRPLSQFLDKWSEVKKTLDARVGLRLFVVGGGAAAVELAAGLQMRINKFMSRGSEVHLVSKGSRLCASYSEETSEMIKQSLLKRAIKVHLDEPVYQIHQKNIRLSSGETLEFDFVFVATPARPPNLVLNKVDSTLRLAPNIFGVGDAVEMLGQTQLPKSGVTAVRQGQLLVKNIRNLLENLELMEYKAKSKQLNILVTGKNSAHLIWGDICFEGSLPFHIKKWIDERYMKSFTSIYRR